MLRTSRLALFTMLAACGGDDAQQDTPDAAPAIDAPQMDADPSPLAVTLHFSPVVGSAAFACGQSYPHMGTEDTTITPKDFRFYATAIALVDATGTHVPLTLTTNDWQYQNVAMIDFEDFTGGCTDGTPETNRVITGTVPRGTYTGVAFDIGVPEAMNHQDLTGMPTPLNYTSLWWTWNFGHIFLAAVSHTEITDPTPGVNDHYVHVGASGCTGDAMTGGTVTCTNLNHPHVELAGFDAATGTIDVDYGAILATSALTSSEGCHSFSRDTCAGPFAALGLDYTTGAVTAAPQQVFRVHR